jgi:hypothetical protein
METWQTYTEKTKAKTYAIVSIDKLGHLIPCRPVSLNALAKVDIFVIWSTWKT